MWQHLEYPRILPNVATSVLHQMWQHSSTLGYYQMWLLLYSTKCGNIRVPSDVTKCGYFCTPPNVATFGVPSDITKCGYFCTPPNVATFGVPSDITKCGYFCTPPNVATFGVPSDNTKCGYFCTPPNVATFGIPLDITKCGYFCTPPNALAARFCTCILSKYIIM